MGIFDSFKETIKGLVNEYEERNKVSMKCSSCGANIVGRATDRAIKCEFCGNLTNNKHYSPILNNPVNEISKSSATDEDNEEFWEDNDFDDDDFEDSDEEVFAYIEKGGLFFEGEIPGMSFSRVTLCDSYKDCVNKLKDKFYSERRSAFYKKPKQNLSQIKREHPKAKIIIIND